jgi:hypothetical protein
VSATRIAILVALFGAHCSRGEASEAGGPPSAPPAGAELTPGAVATAAPPPASSGAEGAAPVGGSWVTCYGHFRPTGAPARDVVRLGRLCGEANGMKLLGTTIEGDADEAARETKLTATSGDCFRIFAVADPAVPDLVIEVRDARGKILAGDHNNDRWPIVNPEGPFCVTRSSDLSIRVRARASRGRFAMQVWRLP